MVLRVVVGAAGTHTRSHLDKSQPFGATFVQICFTIDSPSTPLCSVSSNTTENIPARARASAIRLGH